MKRLRGNGRTPAQAKRRTTCKVCEARINGDFGGYCGLCSDQVLGDDSHRDDGYQECSICLENIVVPWEKAEKLRDGSAAHERCAERLDGWDCASCGRLTVEGEREGDFCVYCLEEMPLCAVCSEPIPCEWEVFVRPDGTTVCEDCDQPTAERIKK